MHRHVAPDDGQHLPRWHGQLSPADRDARWTRGEETEGDRVG